VVNFGQIIRWPGRSARRAAKTPPPSPSPRRQIAKQTSAPSHLPLRGKKVHPGLSDKKLDPIGYDLGTNELFSLSAAPPPAQNR